MDLGDADRSIGSGAITFNAAVNTTISSYQSRTLKSEYVVVNGGSHQISAQMLGSPNTRIMGHGDLTLTNVNTYTFCIGSNEGRAPTGLSDTYTSGTVTLSGDITSGGCLIGDWHYTGLSPVTVVIGGSISNSWWFTGLFSGITVTATGGSHLIKDTHDGVYISDVTFDGPGNLTFATNTYLDNAIGTGSEVTYTMNGTGNVIFEGLKEADWQPNMGLIKAGPGVMEIQGAASYTGSTTVNAGTLMLGTNGSIASTSIRVAAGGVLDATATASYTMAGANTYTFGINPAGTGSAGRIDAGALDISNANVVLNVQGWLDDQVYVLATYTPPLTGAQFANVTGLPQGYAIDYAYHENQIALIRTPGTGAMLTVK